MTSKISYYKIALDDLRHRMWMVALSCLGSLLAMPVFFLFSNGDYLRQYHYSLTYNTLEIAQWSLRRHYYGFVEYYDRVSCGIILFLGALIVGIFGFRYLYSRRMVDLYHAMPVKREKLFLIHYIDGLLIWLLPMLISMAITLVLLLVNMLRYGIADSFGAIVLLMGRNLLLFVLAFLTVYHFCLLCVMLCGNAFNAICTTILGGILVAGLWVLNASYSQTYLDTYLTPALSARQIFWASPLVNAILLLCETADGSHLFVGEGFYLCMSILVILSAFGGAFYLYQRRPSELAEHGIDAPFPSHLLRIGVSIAAGLSLGALFIMILEETSYGWILFGIVLGTFMVFGILNVIFHMDFRAFFKYKLELLLTIAFACLLLPAYRFDLTGFNSRLPAKNNIIGVRYEVSGLGDNLSFYNYGSVLDTPASIDQDGFLHYEDNTAVYSFLQSLAGRSHHLADDTVYCGVCTVCLQRRDGSLFVRTYRLLDSDLKELKAIVEDDRFRETYYPVSSGLLGTPDEMLIDCALVGQTYQKLTAEQREAIMEAYARDFKAHYRLEELAGGVSVCDLRLDYTNMDTRYLGAYNIQYLPVFESYTETIAAILQYYPEAPITAENLKVASIDIDPGIRADHLPKEILYAYFGLDGYPSYSEAVDAYYESLGMTEADIYAIYADDTQHTSFRLIVDDPKDMADLLPYLHTGSLHTWPLYNASPDRYIHVGALVLENGKLVSCYADSGQFPKEWIDRIEALPDEEGELYYDVYDYDMFYN